MLKHMAILVALVAGCGGEVQQTAQEAAASPAVAASPGFVSPLVGCWADATPAVTETVSINADGTCSDAVAAQRMLGGAPYTQTVTKACTWAPQDSSSLTFAYSDSAPLCTYLIIGDTMTLLCPYMHEPQAYQRVACQ